MGNGTLLPHLFRTEYSKIVAVLCRHFGLKQVEIAEDIASDTFMAAAQGWGINGMPAEPVAWLYRVASNKARNHLRREQIFTTKVTRETLNNLEEFEQPEIDLSPKGITDSQLQMIFAVCHPALALEGQVSLALRILCGFGIDEIADAFMVGKDTINKRLYRAREKLRESGCTIAMPAEAELESRMGGVLKTIYLLFNEGYYSISNNATLRKDLCLEAIRLCNMLLENGATNRPEVNALMALMCFHASRFEARTGSSGEQVLYDEQDTSLWNMELVGKGSYFLHLSASGDTLSKYHIEACIAYWHTQRADTGGKWEHMLLLYDQLLALEYSPTAVLNRVYVLYKTGQTQKALAEAGQLAMDGNQFYHTLLGVLYSGTDPVKARASWWQALQLARTDMDRRIIQRKIDALP